ncbi:protein tyrosine phosphatase type IVA 3 isoform X2 [Nematostella vectensis]|uniref:protein tyrosine phosphatase type IVA 3 isoform X2 n=1 Tax=Nematostella vectensis TaxID=45351 RepID=UPI00138FEE97|nr:protein tyrosine phosphatase type IVA 3 isoform X2 [Nematostella vectensis]
MKMPTGANRETSFHGPGAVMLEYKSMKFLITDRPTNSTLPQYIQDWPFDDGAAPPKQLVEDWLKLLKGKFKERPGSCVAVHCVAGLGRAPVLVALALIESGMKYEDAVEFIRRKRRGAINAKQLSYLERYKPTKLLKEKDGGPNCVIQ